MGKLIIPTGTVLAAVVAVAVATALGGNTNAEIGLSGSANAALDRMPSIERMTIEARDLPVQNHHAI